MTFRYLAANITSNRNLKEEMQAQMTKATMISGYLRDVICRNKYIRLKSKIYKTCVKLVIIYAIETRAETTKAITKPSSIMNNEMKTLRRIIGNTLQNRIRDEDIHNIHKIQDVMWAKIRKSET